MEELARPSAAPRFLNLPPLRSEFPGLPALPSDLHLNKHIKKKTAIRQQRFVCFFFFLSEDGLFTEIKSPQEAPNVDVYRPPHPAHP